jgi:hypothetical protein
LDETSAPGAAELVASTFSANRRKVVTFEAAVVHVAKVLQACEVLTPQRHDVRRQKLVDAVLERVVPALAGRFISRGAFGFGRSAVAGQVFAYVKKIKLCHVMLHPMRSGPVPFTSTKTYLADRVGTAAKPRILVTEHAKAEIRAFLLAEGIEDECSLCFLWKFWQTNETDFILISAPTAEPHAHVAWGRDGRNGALEKKGWAGEKREQFRERR